MLKLVKSSYVRLLIFDYITTKRILQIIKHSKEFLKIFEYTKSHYKLYKLFINEIDLENDINITSYFNHYTIKFPEIEKVNLKEFFFRCIRDLEKIPIFPRKEISIECLNYLYDNYFGKIIICLANPFKEVPLIKNNINEIRFLFERIDTETKNDYLPYIKTTLFDKIENKESVEKIKLFENLNLDKEDNEDLYYELMKVYPNATYNIESEFAPDIYYYSQIGKYNNFKLNIPILVDDEIETLNKILIGKNDLIDLTLNLKKNSIEYINDYLKNNIVKYFCLINFLYEENKFYLEDLKHIEKLWIIQRFYKANKYSFNISPKLNTLKVFSCEKVFMSEKSFCIIINNNPLLETVKYDKNYSDVERFTIEAAKSLSNLKFLKNLTTDNFDKNESESKFYLNLKSKSIRNLDIFNEGFVNFQILDINIPNLEYLVLENIDLVDYESNKVTFSNLTGVEMRRIKDKNFFKELVRINNLEELSYSSIEKDNYIELTNIISQLKKLENLTIIPNFFSQIGENLIIDFINKIIDFPLLEDLCIGIPVLTEKIIDCVYNNVIKINKLYSLRIIVSKYSLTMRELLMEKILSIKNIISQFEFI